MFFDNKENPHRKKIDFFDLIIITAIVGLILGFIKGDPKPMPEWQCTPKMLEWQCKGFKYDMRRRYSTYETDFDLTHGKVKPFWEKDPSIERLIQKKWEEEKPYKRGDEL